MFDTYKIDRSHTTYSPSKIDVVEKKAPTDESIRLLKEMQEKAFDNVVSCFQLSNNELNDITCWIYPDQYSFEERARIRFKLNGEVIDFTFKLPCKYIDASGVIPYIREKIVEQISNNVGIEFVTKTLKHWEGIYKR
jgi:hypothetical protein